MATVKSCFRDGAERPVLTIDPKENILIGLRSILAYLHLRSATTFITWVEVYSLPAIKRPDGQWMTSMTALDNWIWLGAEIDNKNRPFSRGTNERWDIALAHAQRRAVRAKNHKTSVGPIDALFKTHEELYGQDPEKTAALAAEVIQAHPGGTPGSGQGDPASPSRPETPDSQAPGS